LKTDIGLAVLGDALAVGFILFALIEMFGPVSGAHFNPAVSLAMALSGQLRWRIGIGAGSGCGWVNGNALLPSDVLS
jgi:glycerol uptake facilitator-like aquaporin